MSDAPGQQRPSRRAFCAPHAAVALLGLAALIIPAASATSLKTMYDLAGPGNGYDKLIVLDPGATYTGGLWIGATYNRMAITFDGQREKVRIDGHGAILDLQGTEICIAYCQGSLDIEDCVIINGGVRFRGYDDGVLHLKPEGSVRYVTFYQPHDYGVRVFGCGDNILVERNIVVDAVDTGQDCVYLTGIPMPWMITGANFGLSLQGDNELYDNWSFHTDPLINADLTRHYVYLCEYG